MTSSKYFFNMDIAKQDTAIQIFSLAVEKKLYIRVDCLPLVACVVYVAARISNQCIWLGYVAAKSGVSKVALGQLYGSLRDSLSLKPCRLLPEHLVMRVASLIKVQARHIDLIIRICRTISDNSVAGTSCPQTIATSVIVAVVFAAGEHLDLNSVASCSLLSVAAINKTYRVLKPVLSEIVLQLLDSKDCSYRLALLPDCLESVRSRRGVGECFQSGSSTINPVVQLNSNSEMKPGKLTEQFIGSTVISNDAAVITAYKRPQKSVCNSSVDLLGLFIKRRKVMR